MKKTTALPRGAVGTSTRAVACAFASKTQSCLGQKSRFDPHVPLRQSLVALRLRRDIGLEITLPEVRDGRRQRDDLLPLTTQPCWRFVWIVTVTNFLLFSPRRGTHGVSRRDQRTFHPSTSTENPRSRRRLCEFPSLGPVGCLEPPFIRDHFDVQSRRGDIIWLPSRGSWLLLPFVCALLKFMTTLTLGAQRRKSHGVNSI